MSTGTLELLTERNARSVVSQQPVQSTLSERRERSEVGCYGGQLTIQAVPGWLLIGSPGPLPRWFEPVRRQLEAILRLPPDWDSYGAAQPAQDLHVPVLRLIDRMMFSPAVPLPQLVPNPTGGIGFEWHERGIDLEVTVHPTGSVEVFGRDLSGELGVWEGRLEDCQNLVGRALMRLAGSA